MKLSVHRFVFDLCVCAVFGGLGTTAGCTTPAKTTHELVTESGFLHTIQHGEDFDHVVYTNQFDNKPLAELHVYIEGDGTPWVDGLVPAEDPTPKRALALELMVVDSNPSLYLGRPCYFGLSHSSGCSSEYWTFKRYSPEVVRSMAQVIQNYQKTHHVEKTVLIGYSGGGVLAALIAGDLERDLEGELFILTLAANLDTEGWVKIRRFLSLDGSLNPLNHRTEIADIPQLHLAGLRDEIVPPQITRSYAAGLDSKRFRYYPRYDHVCCWLELWPQILVEKPWAVIDTLE